MKRFLLLFLITISMHVTHAQSMKEMFSPRWQTTQQYVSEVTELLGEEHIDFRATDSVMTAREQLQHICNHLNWVYGMLGGETIELDWKTLTQLSDLQNMQEKTFTNISAWVNQAKEEELKETVFFRPAQREYTKNELLLLLLDHTRDHTGQLVVYLRLNNIEPPKYKGW